MIKRLEELGDCPKCGCKFWTKSYHRVREAWVLGNCLRVDGAFICPEGAHLHARCGACSYTVPVFCQDDQAAFPVDYTDEDEPVDEALPEDNLIANAHPIYTGRHDIYAEALRLVTAKHSKGALVNIVNWLLYEQDQTLLAVNELLVNRRWPL